MMPRNNGLKPSRPKRVFTRLARTAPLTRKHVSAIKSTPKRRKTPKLSQLKKELEKLQKQLVIKLYGKDCYTCPQKNLEGANCQLGHVPWPRAVLSVTCKYDVRFARIQCFRDNIHLGGMGAVALQRMKDEGIDTDALWKLNEATKNRPRGVAWFTNKIAEYQSLL